MIKLLLTFTILFSFINVHAQHYNLLLRRHDKIVNNFFEGSMMAFQLNNNRWEYGKVTTIKKDSVYIKPLMIQYSFLHADTLVSFVTGFALKDIHAFPKPGVVVDYDRGNFRINKASSHVQAYWLKSGYILRIGALGYAALNIINSISQDELSIKNNGLPLGIAAAVLATGVLLNKSYKPKYVVGKRYQLEVLDISK